MGEDQTALGFWQFLWRSIGQAVADSVAFFGLDVKSAITAVALVTIGLALVWKVKGAGALQDEVSNYALLTLAPLILFFAFLLVWSAVRAPYAIYIKEHVRIIVLLEASEGARVAAEQRVTALEAAATAAAERLKPPVNTAATKPTVASPDRAVSPSSNDVPRRVALSDAQCTQLAGLVGDYDGAINRATAARFSDATRAEMETAFNTARDWLAANAGAVQRQSFESASPVAYSYSGLPSAYAAMWQVSQGRLGYLKELANKLCG